VDLSACIVRPIGDGEFTDHDKGGGCFEDIMKIDDSFTPSSEVESHSPNCTVLLCVRCRLKANLQF